MKQAIAEMGPGSRAYDKVRRVARTIADIDSPQTATDLIRGSDAAFPGPQRPQLQGAIRKWRRDNGYP